MRSQNKSGHQSDRKRMGRKGGQGREGGGGGKGIWGWDCGAMDLSSHEHYPQCESLVLTGRDKEKEQQGRSREPSRRKLHVRFYFPFFRGITTVQGPRDHLLLCGQEVGF
jgi:hypothetical protein